jgi:aquaporin Z
MKKYIVEFIGTFFLILTVCMASIGGSGEMASIAIGAMLMVMVYAGGHISGAHYNPAVTLAVWLRGKVETKDLGFYFAAQFLAAVLAAFTASQFLASVSILAPKPTNIIPMYAVLAEVLGAFALTWVVLNVAAKQVEGNQYYGLAIGFTFTACATALTQVSGGAFNPAIALGLCVAKKFVWSSIWVYFVGGFGGAILAAYVYRFVHAEE